MLIGSIATAGTIKVWNTSDTLTASDLNGNFSHIHNLMVGGHGARLIDADVNASAAISSSKLAAYRLIPVAYARVLSGSPPCSSGSCTLTSSNGVTSISRTSVGLYLVTLTSAQTDQTYMVVPTSNTNGVYCGLAGTVTTATFNVKCYDGATPSLADADISVLVFAAN
jgi:hypothetical protein